MQHQIVGDDEFPTYFKRYVDKVPPSTLLDGLEQNTAYVLDCLRSISAEQSAFRYAPGKWSIAQLLLHINDTERVFAYRLLTALRGDTTSLLPSYDENAFARESESLNRSWTSLVEEFEILRQSLMKLCEGVSQQDWIKRVSTPAGTCTARALVMILIGHSLHHLGVLRDKYEMPLKPMSV